MISSSVQFRIFAFSHVFAYFVAKVKIIADLKRIVDKKEKKIIRSRKHVNVKQLGFSNFFQAFSLILLVAFLAIGSLIQN